MLFDNLINRIRTNIKSTNSVINSSNTKDINIEVTNDNNFTKVDIKEDCNLAEYMKAISKLNIREIDEKIANITLFDNGVKLIKSKVIYVFSHEDKTYNLYLNNNMVFINERTINKNNEENYIIERIIEIDLFNMQYKITTRNHDKYLSTHNIKYYNSKNNESSFFVLNKMEALNIIKEIFKNLNEVPNINNIINLDFILSNLDLNIEEKSHTRL